MGRVKQWKRRTAILLAFAMVLSGPTMQTFANEMLLREGNGKTKAVTKRGSQDGVATDSNAHGTGDEENSVEISTASNADILEKKYDNSNGSEDVTGLLVPTLAYDDTSISLVWDKPEKYDDVANYKVYQDGELIGDARSNFAEHADWAATYMESFYAYYSEKDVSMVDVDIHSFRVTDLQPETEYEFEVVAVDEEGMPLGASDQITWSTTPTPEIFNIESYGAKPVVVGYTSYDANKNMFIEKNTRAIQNAIDACSEGGRVVVPEGIWMTGALYLKSNMTLELKEGAVLFGSPNVDHYDQNYLLYPYSTDTRSWALINAYSADENGMLENIRIVGKGTIYGNGWKYGAKDSISGTGYESYYQNRATGDPDWTNQDMSKYALKQWVGGNNSKVYNASNPSKSYGVLAMDASKKGQEEKGLTPALAYATRPNLVVLRGTNGVYLEGFRAENPAFHTVAILDSENVACENVKFITYDVNNADGIEIGNTQNVMIYNNFFDTGDDGINFATGMGKGVHDSEQKPSDSIWTFNNFLRECHGGAIAAGSHTGAGISNMLVEDNVMNHSDMPFRFKSAPVNGGGVYNILIRDCAIADAQQVFVLSTTYSDANQTVSVEPADRPAEFYNIEAYNITADVITKNTMSLIADVDYETPYKTWHTHNNLYFQDIAFTNIDQQLAKKSEELRGISNAVFYDVTMEWKGIDKNPEGDANAANYKAWASLKACSDLQFIGTTTMSTSAYNAMAHPTWKNEDELEVSIDSVNEDNYTSASATLSWPNAQDGTQPVGQGAISGYIVETYLDDVMIDQRAMLSGTSHKVTGLSTNVEYEFKVFAVDSTGMRSEPLVALVNTEGETDIMPVCGPTNKKVTFSGLGYTWGTAKFSSAKKTDKRVRGYYAYVGDELVATVYNYQLKDGDTSNDLSMTVGRMMEDSNEVTLKAFTDAGLEFQYNKSIVNTTPNYDHLAPVWTDPVLDVQIEENDVILTWTEPEDESGIYAYRVYVDGVGVTKNENDYFNHVNGYYTTQDTTYTISDLNLSEYHTFKIEAADAWWKAVDGSGPFHWTFSGPFASIGETSETYDGLWKAVTFGQSTDLNFSSNVLEDKVGTNYVWSVDTGTILPTEVGAPVQDVIIESRGGKIQSGHDGLTFYYTEIPTDQNFKLSADVTIEHMGPENNKAPNQQEGAGLMVRDVNGAPRKDPLEEGYEEYPAASNMVMLEVIAASKSVNAGLSVKAMARYGVNRPAGNLNTPTPNSVFAKNIAVADSTNAPADVFSTNNYYDAKMTLILERTDDGFKETYVDAEGAKTAYTFTDSNVTPNIVEHLDGEYMRVGFFASRNARMKVENIQLITSDVITSDETPAYVAPNAENSYIYAASSSYSNSSEYTVQVLANLDGVISIKQNGNVIVNQDDISGGVQFAYQTILTNDITDFEIIYIASEGKESGVEKRATITVNKEKYNKDLYVSPTGTSEAAGTEESPMDILTGVEKIMPGGTVYMLEGEYEPFKIPMEFSGNEDKMKSLIAMGEVVVTGGSSKLFELDADYWYIEGLDINGKGIVGSRGVLIGGSHNIMESCLIHDTSSDAGLTITKSRSSRNLWPSYNKIANCESYNNHDESGINADGFASKSGAGDDNYFINCVSHDNADDGWDLYNTLAAGANGRTIIENCVAYNNGNNGFKLGGEGCEVAHQLINSVAYHNGLDGITDNFNSGELVIRNNTVYDNKRFNIILRPSPYKTDENDELTADGTVQNNVSYRSDEYTEALDKVYDDKVACKVDENNFFYMEGKNSTSANDFMSFDTADCFSWEAGKIIFGNFLRRVEGSKLDILGVGADLPGKASSPEPEPEPSKKEYSSGRDIIIPVNVRGTWEKEGEMWKFQKEAGGYASAEWCYINGEWYYFDGDAMMATGWRKLGDFWYYLNENGTMATGWLLYKEQWYWLNLNGDMTSTPIRWNNKTYYFSQEGACTNP